MSFPSRVRAALGGCHRFAFNVGYYAANICPDDVLHIVKGVVKSIDKGTKTMVVTAADGTEHTIKWTDKTAAAGGKDVGDAFVEGSKVSVQTQKRPERKRRWE